MVFARRTLAYAMLASALLCAAMPASTAQVEALTRVPGNSAMKTYDTALKKLSGHIKVWYFYLSTCPYCRRQEPILKTITDYYDIPVQPISLDGGPPPGGEYHHFITNKGQAQKLGVVATPTLYLVNTTRKQAAEITAGFVPGQTLMARMVRAARLAGWMERERHGVLK